MRRKDFFARAEAHLEFHILLARAARNPIMEAVMQALIDVMRQFIHTLGPQQINEYILPSRRRFMIHFEARNGDAACAEMERHLRRVNETSSNGSAGTRRAPPDRSFGLDAGLLCSRCPSRGLAADERSERHLLGTQRLEAEVTVRACISGVRTTRSNSPASLSVIAVEMPAGAKAPAQPFRPCMGYPSSSKVGTSESETGDSGR